MSWLALIATILVALLMAATATTETVDVERDALMALYNNTDGANWTIDTGWGSDSLHCNWYGVQCHPVNGNVTVIVLSHNNLNGPIPPELRNLSGLLYLDVRDNQLNGPIPPELGTLSSLQLFVARYNNLSGPIPAELGNLSSLGTLWLRDNSLNGPIPAELGNLSSLVNLALDNNQLSGPIPVVLSNLSNLLRLNLDGNPSLGCWQTEAALVWAQGLLEYFGPEVVCSSEYLPIVISASG